MDRARLVIVSAILAGVATALAFALWPRRRPPPLEAPPPVEEVERGSLAAASGESDEPPASLGLPPSRTGTRSDAPSPSGAPSPAQLGDAALEGPLTPELLEHAKQMILPAASLAMDKRDGRHLKELLQFLDQHRGEGVVSDGDRGAIEAALACLEREPDAREEAADFVRFGGATTLTANLEKACGLR